MDTIEFIADSLRQSYQRIVMTCEGLTPDQLTWRPAPHANNIGYILLHTARAMDGLTCRAAGVPSLWQAEAWHQRLGLPAALPNADDGAGLRALPVPDGASLLAFLADAAERAQMIVRGLPTESLGEAVGGDGTRRGDLLRHVLTHTNNHHGQMDFLRGLQDRAWDLKPGTGMVLPQR